MFIKICLQLLILANICESACKGATCGEQETRDILDFNGVSYDHNVVFEGIRWKTIKAVVWLEAESDCSIHVTGATEGGKTEGFKDYYNGYKINVKRGHCVDNYVTETFEKLEPIGSVRVVQYRSKRRYIYTNVQHNWSILVV